MVTIRRRPLVALLLGLALAGLAPPPAPPEAAIRPAADQAAELGRIEAYFNGLRSLRSRFVQINPDGGRSSGELFYARPDKMRLDYDPPNPILIVANGWQMIYHDRKLKQVTHLFTSQTPLGFLLGETVRLSGDVTVTGFERQDGELLVTLVQTKEPGQGSITLVFAAEPLALRRWSVVDQQGLVTQVVLENLEQDVALDDKLFRLCDPTAVIRAGCD
jgi:outer membrane lipoprotein-sorting protein